MQKIKSFFSTFYASASQEDQYLPDQNNDQDKALLDQLTANFDSFKRYHELLFKLIQKEVHPTLTRKFRNKLVPVHRYFHQYAYYYQGEKKNGKPHGLGRAYWEDKYFFGYFFEGVPDQTGIYIYQNGTVYEGELKMGKLDGRGILRKNQDYYYEGEWLNGKRHGKGMEQHLSGSWFVGKFSNNEMEKGELYHFNKTTMKKNIGMDPLDRLQYIKSHPMREVYIGTFKEGNYHGSGTYFWADGRMYKGTWSSGRMNGSGVFMWPDGKKYIGDYYQDQKSGKGKMIWSDQKTYIGDFFKGMPHGDGMLILKSKQIYGKFMNGKLVKRHQMKNVDDGTASVISVRSNVSLGFNALGQPDRFKQIQQRNQLIFQRKQFQSQSEPAKEVQHEQPKRKFCFLCEI